MERFELMATSEYIRLRLTPRPGDPDYLSLIDLLAAIRAMAPADAKRILDYGCGGSPYRTLFPGAIYHRADLFGGDDLDFAYAEDSRLPKEAGQYDFVLSSQVLEHVLDPASYLSECFRVLKPGGRLLVTTHGTFWDHACPHDYWRWTAHGLRRAVETAGFKTLEAKKITTGTRAALFLFEQQLNTRFEGAGWYGEILTGIFTFIRMLGATRFHEMADRSLGQYAIVDAEGIGETPAHALYIGIAILAQKPLSAP